MNAVELEKELWNINNELVKAGIKPHEYPSMADAVADLRGQYNKYKALFDEAIRDRDRLLDEKAAQQSVQRTCSESPYGTHQFMSNDPLAICVFCGASR